jgi:queuine tRNA-ribosyltransferase
VRFQVIQRVEGGGARLGELWTPHGAVKTPVFMPVGTMATVKSLTAEDLYSLGAEIILANTYHLWLRPGVRVVKGIGGLHRFMHWERPLLTDSGGYQVFSLAPTSQVNEEGVTFQSHLDGSRHCLTPEQAMRVQEALGADIIMCLDECIPYPTTAERARQSTERTVRWAKRCRAAKTRSDQALFAVVQGGTSPELRRLCMEALGELDFPGYAIGGLSVGEPREAMLEAAAAVLPRVPADRPRYLMGVGAPEDLVEMVGIGADMFDCVLPTRGARTGQLFTTRGRIVIKNSRHQEEDRPIDERCTCYTCRHYSRAYLRHLFLSRELLAYRLNTIHNLWYFLELMRELRRAIAAGTFAEFRADFYRERGQDGANSE